MNSTRIMISFVRNSLVSLCVFLSAASIVFAGNSLTPPMGFSLNRLPMGMNIGSLAYYTPQLVFTDAMKSSGPMFSYPHGTYTWDSGKVSQIPVDSNGWPLQIPYIVDGVQQDVRFMLNSYYEGEYVMLYDGEGAVTITGITSSVVDGKKHLFYPSSANHVNNISVNISSSTNGNPIRNMRIIPVAYLNSESSMPTFRPDFISGLRPFHALRFMDFSVTNNSTQVEWTDRNKKTTYSQGNGKGAAWEYIIELSNQLGVDPWICVPHQASDDYITQLATLFKNTLSPDRKLYLEYSNELWNSPFGQAQFVWNNAPGHANSYVSTDLATIGTPTHGYFEKDAYMIARTFRLFAGVYAGEMSSRVVKVAAGCLANPTGVSDAILNYLENVAHIRADSLAVGGYFYFNPNDHATWKAMDPAAVTPEMILQSANAYYDAFTGTLVTRAKAVAEAHSVDYIVYEGGQHMPPYGQQVWAYNHAVYDAQITSGMYDLYMRNFAAHQTAGVKLFMAYSYVGTRQTQAGSWGHLESLNQLNSPGTLKNTAPKYKALLDWKTAP